MVLNFIPSTASPDPWDLKRVRICVSVGTDDLAIDPSIVTKHHEEG